MYPRAGGSYSVVVLSAGQITREQLHEVSGRAADVDEFDFDLLPVGPLKCMRRDRGAGAPHVDHPREEFFGSAAAFAQIPRGQRQAQFDSTRP